LNEVQRGAISECVVTNKDRLCRFAFDLLTHIFDFHGTKITVINQDMKPEIDSTTELAEDLIAITTGLFLDIMGVVVTKYNTKNCKNNEKKDGKKKTKKKMKIIGDASQKKPPQKHGSHYHRYSCDPSSQSE
jgi:predicted site-specific integrase-resolvase